ncbi:MAG: preprotein translocase subunit SecG [Holosporaceae bacterium]|jgi:preprotein translocase subunit SecG|nr:preprotein translocase subunit SecG [Holosporaceae bacterium]
MLSFLLAVHFVLTIVIIGLVLLQKHDSDGALGSSGGGSAASGMFSVRGQANLLTRSTAVLMTIFILNCLVMAKIVKRAHNRESVIDRVAQESVPINDTTAEEQESKKNITKKSSEAVDAAQNAVNGKADSSSNNSVKELGKDITDSPEIPSPATPAPPAHPTPVKAPAKKKT